MEAVNEAVNYLKPVINTIASLPMLDGPLPIGDAVAAVAIAVVAVGVVSYAAIKSASTTKAKDVAASMPKTNNKDVYFPENPYDFAPKGLVFMGPYETFNGKIIKWNYQGVIEIFEWDEDKKEGPHYHVGGHDNTHYYAGDKVPELYASVFF